MKATINQTSSETIIQGEDKIFNFYCYDSVTLEPIDFTGKTINACLKNTLLTKATFAAAMGTGGKFVVTVGKVASAALLVSSNPWQLEITTTIGGALDIEILTNSFVVVTPLL